MPSFTYKCNKCSEINQLVHGLKSVTDPECKICHSNDLTRVLKGSGFHITGDGVYKQGFSEYKPTVPTKDGKIFTGENE